MAMKFPVLKKKHANKIAVLMAAVGDLQGQIRNLHREIDVKVEKALGDKIDMIEGGLRESILQKEVLIDKGLLTRAEMNAKYAEMREKANG